MLEKCVNPNEMLAKVREAGLVGGGSGKAGPRRA
jgi:hypothetical protein